jgi:hypothetical protein
VINTIASKARAFATASQFHPSLIFPGKDISLLLQWSLGSGRLANIRLGLKWLAMKNALAYNTGLLTTNVCIEMG